MRALDSLYQNWRMCSPPQNISFICLITEKLNLDLLQNTQFVYWSEIPDFQYIIDVCHLFCTMTFR